MKKLKKKLSIGSFNFYLFRGSGPYYSIWGYYRVEMAHFCISISLPTSPIGKWVRTLRVPLNKDASRPSGYTGGRRANLDDK